MGRSDLRSERHPSPSPYRTSFPGLALGLADCAGQIRLEASHPPHPSSKGGYYAATAAVGVTDCLLIGHP